VIKRRCIYIYRQEGFFDHGSVYMAPGLLATDGYTCSKGEEDPSLGVSRAH